MTHLELLNTLPEPYRSQAIENVKVQMDEDADVWFNETAKHPLHTIIMVEIWWDDTPEGVDYWSDIYDRAEAGEFDIKTTEQ